MAKRPAILCPPVGKSEQILQLDPACPHWLLSLPAPAGPLELSCLPNFPSYLPFNPFSLNPLGPVSLTCHSEKNPNSCKHTLCPRTPLGMCTRPAPTYLPAPAYLPASARLPAPTCLTVPNYLCTYSPAGAPVSICPHVYTCAPICLPTLTPACEQTCVRWSYLPVCLPTCFHVHSATCLPT